MNPDKLDTAVTITRTDILREWFGGDRYARDYEYLDANFGKQADGVVAYLAASLPFTGAGMVRGLTDARYFVENGKPLQNIGAGDALAIIEDMPDTLQEAWAAGWNACAALEPVAVEAEAEPVAWRYRWAGGTGCWSEWMVCTVDPHDWTWPPTWKDFEAEPLYTAPLAVDQAMRVAYLMGREQWCPAGILADKDRTERDWQKALAALKQEGSK